MRWRLSGLAFPRGRTAAVQSWTAELPSDDPLATYVMGCWRMTWRFPPGVEVATKVVPSGCVNIVFEPTPTGGRRLPAKVVGARTHAFPLLLPGAGESRGILFTPGGFAALFASDGERLADRVVDLAEALPNLHRALVDAMLADDDLDRALAATTALMRECVPQQPSADLRRLHRGWDFVSERKVEPTLPELADALDCTPRTLQRTWRRLLGFGPKRWLRIRRFQLVLQRLRHGERVDFAALATSMGYADQSHLIRDFRAFAGALPTEILATPSPGP